MYTELRKDSDNTTIQLNINFSVQQLVAAIKQLSPSEKLQINEALWDSTMDIPLEHQTLVLERVKSARKNPEQLLTWDEAAKTLKA
jgi:hypothetical protein